MELKEMFELLGIITLGCHLARAKNLVRALAKGQNPIFLNRGSFLTARPYMAVNNKTIEKLPYGRSPEALGALEALGCPGRPAYLKGKFIAWRLREYLGC